MSRKMPFILVAAICAIILLDPVMSKELKQGFYSLSLSIKELITILLPFIIFGLLFKAIVTLADNATKIIGIVLILVCSSNFLSTFLSHYVGMWVYHFDLSILAPHGTEALLPLWSTALPQLVSNDKAMFSGVMLGMIVSRCYPRFAAQMADKMERYIGYVLGLVVYLMPLFVVGFIVKMQCDGVIEMIVKDYAIIFIVIGLAQFIYLSLVYFVLNNFKIYPWVSSIKNMMPAAISGFSTMSSAASMPLTLVGVENNVRNKDMARSVISATVNIHLVGDCFAIPILAYAILKSFGMAEPGLLQYLIFAFYFILAKFSVAAIPGGGIVVMLPILERYMGFNGDMLSLITALYILFDPITTCANVLGNGGFAQLIDKLVRAPAIQEKEVNLTKQGAENC